MLSLKKIFAVVLSCNLLFCAGPFDGAVLCVEGDGSFHVEFGPCMNSEGSGEIGASENEGGGLKFSTLSRFDACNSCTDRALAACSEDCKALTALKAPLVAHNAIPLVYSQALIFLPQPIDAPHPDHVRQTALSGTGLDRLRTVVLLI